jgi:hypothetical protein
MVQKGPHPVALPGRHLLQRLLDFLNRAHDDSYLAGVPWNFNLEIRAVF